MKIVLQLSRADLGLARAEAEALYPRPKALNSELLLVDGSEKLLRRLVMTRLAGKLLAETNTLDKLRLPSYKSFAVRVAKTGEAAGHDADPRSASSSSAAIILAVAKAIRGRVDLKRGTVVRVFTDGKRHWVTEQLYEYSAGDVACRDVNARPVFHPASLQPKWARLLLNLSGVAKGKILDPFCGIGGILLEAADFGLHAHGVDIDERAVEGANENIWFYHLEKRAKAERADFLGWEGGKYDAIVTDLPYGRSSGLYGRKRDELYAQAFKKMAKHSKRLVVMGPDDLSPMLKAAGWRVDKKFKLYMHKSLMRTIHCCTISSAA